MKFIVALGIIAFLSAFGIALFMAGYEYHQPREIIVDRWHEPEVITLPPQIIETIREIEVIKNIGVIKEVEVVKEVHSSLDDWGDVLELARFLSNDNTDSMVVLVADSRGVIKLDEAPGDEWDCDDRARRLIDQAEAIGKRLSFVYLNPTLARKWFGYDGAHAVCGAIVGDKYYYIDAGTDKICKVCNLD